MKFKIMILAIMFVISSFVKGDTPSFTIQVIPQSQVIRVGQPLVFKLKYIFDQPQTEPDNGQVRESFRHDAYFDIKHEDGSFSVKGYPLFPTDLALEDGQGLVYSKYFLCFYFLPENRPLFPESGKYVILVRGWRNSSIPVTIDVQPASNAEQLAMSLLSDPNDYIYLEAGEHEYKEKRSERMAHLEQVVKQCEETTLAKWASARLGLEYFNKFHKEHPSFQKFKTMRKQTGTEDTLFEQANRYLSKGITLPDEFPIREEVLEKLVTIEYIKGNYEKAISLIDDAAQKYPHSKLGKRSQKTKEELRKLKEKEEQEKNKPAEPNVNTMVNKKS
jgi:hypothetical protein